MDSMMVRSDDTGYCQIPCAYKNLNELLQLMTKLMFEIVN